MEERQPWDENQDEVYEDVPDDFTTYIRVNGSVQPIEVGADLVSTVKQIAQTSKLGKFRLFLNGNEVFPEDSLPPTIEEGMQFEMKPYDKAGC